jgi:hypothetical protein
MRKLSPNRAICSGDRARAGIGEHGEDVNAIQKRIADWSTPFLKSFLATCKSETWRRQVHALILKREGTDCDLQNQNTKRAQRKARGRTKAQSFGRARRVS